MTAVTRTAHATLLVSGTVIAAEQAVRYQTGPQWLAVAVLGCGGLVAVVAACSAAWTETSTRRFARRQAASLTALGLPPSVTYAVRSWRASDEPRNSWRIAEYDQDWAADRANPAWTPRHAAPDDNTVELTPRLPHTLPIPVVKIRQTAPTWGFDGRQVITGGVR